MHTQNPFGGWLREKLFDRRLKQRELSRHAEQAGLGPLSPQRISYILHAGEGGKGVPQWERQTVIRIARALDDGKSIYVAEALAIAGYVPQRSGHSDEDVGEFARRLRSILSNEELRHVIETLQTIEQLRY